MMDAAWALERSVRAGGDDMSRKQAWLCISTVRRLFILLNEGNEDFDQDLFAMLAQSHHHQEVLGENERLKKETLDEIQKKCLQGCLFLGSKGRRLVAHPLPKTRNPLNLPSTTRNPGYYIPVNIYIYMYLLKND
mmetsp:Transcript_25865/g.46748  ORF Transcript_25865/g.46748 Transcript_25865/m.46748 type:complete len:135 (+) Transcript_25865:345-749(+)